MQKLLITTAILAASTLSASAQDLFRGQPAPDEIRASNLMGMRVYASEAAVEGDEIEGVQDGWEDIGEINDIVLARDGSVEAVLVDVGGFLGIGERQVAVDMGSLRMVSDSATPDDVNDYFLVINADRAAIEGAPDYMAAGMGEGAMAEGDQAAAVADASDAAAAAGTTPTDEMATADADMAAEGAMTEGEMEAADTAAMAEGGATATEDAATTDTAMATDDAAATGDAATTDTAMATDTEMATDDAAADTAMATDGAMTDDAAATTETADAAGERTPLSREGYAPLGAEMMTAEALQGAAVYDAEDNRVGEVGDILIDEQGAVSDLVIDVGGFLGIGEKPIALPLGSVDILQQDGGDDLRIYVSQSEDELEAMETYAAE